MTSVSRASVCVCACVRVCVCVCVCTQFAILKTEPLVYAKYSTPAHDRRYMASKLAGLVTLLGGGLWLLDDRRPSCT